MVYKFENLTDFLKKNGIFLSGKQISQFNIYYETLVETNKSFNLTAITELHEVEEKHFMDSAAPAAFLDFGKYDSLIDIGTGAGFPGLPLKIIFPHLKVVLMDSLAKRVNYLNNLVKTLKLSDICAVHSRAEELARNESYRESFDLCVSRAVSNLSSLSELCLPFVRVGGIFLPYKTQNAEDEIVAANNAISKLGGKLESTERLSIGTADLKRSFPIIKKTKNTPRLFPRKNGVPQKKPLL